jgi:hypothetical protein
MNEQFIPEPGMVEGRRVGVYKLFKTDTFLAYRRVPVSEDVSGRDPASDWYFEFNRSADDEDMHRDMALFLKRFRPKRLQ